MKTAYSIKLYVELYITNCVSVAPFFIPVGNDRNRTANRCREKENKTEILILTGGFWNLWLIFCPCSTAKPFMTKDIFTKFLNEKQRDSRLNEELFPRLRADQIKALIEKYEPGSNKGEDATGRTGQSNQTQMVDGWMNDRWMDD